MSCNPKVCLILIFLIPLVIHAQDKSYFKYESRLNVSIDFIQTSEFGFNDTIPRMSAPNDVDWYNKGLTFDYDVEVKLNSNLGTGINSGFQKRSYKKKYSYDKKQANPPILSVQSKSQLAYWYYGFFLKHSFKIKKTAPYLKIGVNHYLKISKEDKLINFAPDLFGLVLGVGVDYKLWNNYQLGIVMRYWSNSKNQDDTAGDFLKMNAISLGVSLTKS